MNALPGRLVLLGHPVSHSLSPVFQNAALASRGIDLRYETLDVAPADLAATLEQARAEGWAGNVTVPHKEAVRAACNRVTAVAERTGAVNAFRASPSGIYGHNTDVEGVRRSVMTFFERPPVDVEFGVIGAGGAASAVLAAIEGWQGCRAIVANRGQERLDRLVARFSSVARAGDVDEIAARANLVINATSLGLRPDDELPIDPARLRPGVPLLDLVSTRHETRLVREARERGIWATDGLLMLVAQGEEAFAWWFGVYPEQDVMWRAVYPVAYDTSRMR